MYTWSLSLCIFSLLYTSPHMLPIPLPLFFVYLFVPSIYALIPHLHLSSFFCWGKPCTGSTARYLFLSLFSVLAFLHLAQKTTSLCTALLPTLQRSFVLSDSTSAGATKQPAPSVKWFTLRRVSSYRNLAKADIRNKYGPRTCWTLSNHPSTMPA